MTGSIILGVIATAIFGGITFGLLVDQWQRRNLANLFGFWLIAALSGVFFVEGWRSLL